MEYNSVENINVEKNKELFEYEMTEVILKLKGEFAAVSGCVARYEEAAVEEDKLQVTPKSLSEVVLEDRKISVSVINNFDAIVLPPVDTVNPQVDVPEVNPVTTKNSISPEFDTIKGMVLPLVAHKLSFAVDIGNLPKGYKTILPVVPQDISIDTISLESISKDGISVPVIKSFNIQHAITVDLTNKKSVEAPIPPNVSDSIRIPDVDIAGELSPLVVSAVKKLKGFHNHVVCISSNGNGNIRIERNKVEITKNPYDFSGFHNIRSVETHQIVVLVPTIFKASGFTFISSDAIKVTPVSLDVATHTMPVIDKKEIEVKKIHLHYPNTRIELSEYLPIRTMQKKDVSHGITQSAAIPTIQAVKIHKVNINKLGVRGLSQTIVLPKEIAEAVEYFAGEEK